ncbi:MAG: hypothetical protein FWH02_01550 [Oscillospiraceae bacterium]|nr:hypothetical protein [Oscillospiraceae bacterium]
MLHVMAHGKQYIEYPRYADTAHHKPVATEKSGDELLDDFFGHFGKLGGKT